MGAIDDDVTKEMDINLDNGYVHFILGICVGSKNGKFAVEVTMTSTSLTMERRTRQWEEDIFPVLIDIPIINSDRVSPFHFSLLSMAIYLFSIDSLQLKRDEECNFIPFQNKF